LSVALLALQKLPNLAHCSINGTAFSDGKVSLVGRPMITTLRFGCGTRTVKAHHFGAEVAAAVITHRLLEYASFSDR
jgi:hypothetical protein